MADLSDVEKSLVTLLAGAFFPDTAYQGGSMVTSPVTGWPTIIYRGWPTDTGLYQDAIAGKVHISIFPEPGMTRNTTRFFGAPVSLTRTTPTITTTVNGAVVTIGGAVTTGNVVGIQYGPPMARQAAAYIVLANDTLTTVAAALAARITGAAASGPMVTLASPLGVGARVGAPQSDMLELNRQDQGFRLSCWCPDPASRDRTATLVSQAVTSLVDASGAITRFMTLESGEQAWLRYRTDYVNDMVSRDMVWRRDICVLVEYATTLIEQNPQLLFIDLAGL